MKMNTGTKVILAGACVLVGLLVWNLRAAQESDRPAKTQWEYIIIEAHDYDRTDQLNKLGSEGWELVHVSRVLETFGLRLKALLESGMTPNIKYEYIFKRRR